MNKVVHNTASCSQQKIIQAAGSIGLQVLIQGPQCVTQTAVIKQQRMPWVESYDLAKFYLKFYISLALGLNDLRHYL